MPPAVAAVSADVMVGEFRRYFRETLLFEGGEPRRTVPDVSVSWTLVERPGHLRAPILAVGTQTAVALVAAAAAAETDEMATMMSGWGLRVFFRKPGELRQATAVPPEAAEDDVVVAQEAIPGVAALQPLLRKHCPYDSWFTDDRMEELDEAVLREMRKTKKQARRGWVYSAHTWERMLDIMRFLLEEHGTGGAAAAAGAGERHRHGIDTLWALGYAMKWAMSTKGLRENQEFARRLPDGMFEYMWPDDFLLFFRLHPERAVQVREPERLMQHALSDPELVQEIMWDEGGRYLVPLLVSPWGKGFMTADEGRVQIVLRRLMRMDDFDAVVHWRDGGFLRYFAPSEADAFARAARTFALTHADPRTSSQGSLLLTSEQVSGAAAAFVRRMEGRLLQCGERPIAELLRLLIAEDQKLILDDAARWHGTTALQNALTELHLRLCEDCMRKVWFARLHGRPLYTAFVGQLPRSAAVETASLGSFIRQWWKASIVPPQVMSGLHEMFKADVQKRIKALMGSRVQSRPVPLLLRWADGKMHELSVDLASGSVRLAAAACCGGEDSISYAFEAGAQDGKLHFVNRFMSNGNVMYTIDLNIHDASVELFRHYNGDYPDDVSSSSAFWKVHAFFLATAVMRAGTSWSRERM